MHARNPYTIDDEAKLVDARTLNGFKASAARARETILSHTNILWAKDGGIAREREDLPNLSPEYVDTATSAVNGRPSLSSQRQHLAKWPIAPDVVSTPDVVQEECDRYGSDVAAAQLFDPCYSCLGPSLFNCGVPFSPDEVLAGRHMNSFEEWLGDLQFSAETATSGQV